MKRNKESQQARKVIRGQNKGREAQNEAAQTRQKPTLTHQRQRPRQRQRGTEWGGAEKAETHTYTAEAVGEAKADGTE